MIGINGRVHMKTARSEAGCIRGKNLTIEEMAARMNLSTNTINDWELGRRVPRHDQLERYCEICGCRPEDICFD